MWFVFFGLVLIVFGGIVSDSSHPHAPSDGNPPTHDAGR